MQNPTTSLTSFTATIENFALRGSHIALRPYQAQVAAASFLHRGTNIRSQPGWQPASTGSPGDMSLQGIRSSSNLAEVLFAGPAALVLFPRNEYSFLSFRAKEASSRHWPSQRHMSRGVLPRDGALRLAEATCVTFLVGAILRIAPTKTGIAATSRGNLKLPSAVLETRVSRTPNMGI
jgi:hypothetical protein